ncbi:hypothetical protein H6G93_09270 [Nostoc sp. FACHB-973]|nr:hypothetical protein [Nostoc sp. FACHB-973]
MYPNYLTLGLLKSSHPDYVELLPALNEIELLASGGYKLKSKIESFLPRRPGEDADIYETRLKKFTYANILGSAINKQLARFNNSSISISGIEDGQDFWNTFRDDTNLAGRSEKNLLSTIFRECLKFKKVFLHVDKHSVPYEVNSKAEEEILGIRPYVTIYPSLQVINWSDKGGEELKWIKVFQISVDSSNPLTKPVTRATWTFIDEQYVARYGAVVELDKNGFIKSIINERGTSSNDETPIPLLSEPVEHGMGKIPVIKIEVPDDLWACNQAASKAVEHLRTDCSKYDLLTLAYFQRTFKRITKPDDDLEKVFQKAFKLLLLVDICFPTMLKPPAVYLRTLNRLKELPIKL